MNRSARGALVHQKIRQGALPRERPANGAGSRPGLGKTCVVCGDRVNPPEFQFDCILHNGETLHFCRECYFLWLNEIDGDSSQTG
jgi:hypothetical protein